MVPPGGVGKGAHVEFEGPGRTVLVGDMEIGVSDRRRFHDLVLSLRLFFLQLRKALRSEQLAERIRCVDRAVDQDMGDMDILGREFGV